MRKDRINIKAFAVANIKVLAVLALIVCNVATANAQRHSLEFKGGAIATSTRNNGAGEAKTIMDYKPGLVVGGSFMWNFMDASLRAVAEGYWKISTAMATIWSLIQTSVTSNSRPTSVTTLHTCRYM